MDHGVLHTGLDHSLRGAVQRGSTGSLLISFLGDLLPSPFPTPPHPLQTLQHVGDTSVSLAPVDESLFHALDILRTLERMFLRQKHKQLGERISPLILCPNCLQRGGEFRITPGSFTESQLQPLREPTIRVSFPLLVTLAHHLSLCLHSFSLQCARCGELQRKEYILRGSSAEHVRDPVADGGCLIFNGILHFFSLLMSPSVDLLAERATQQVRDRQDAHGAELLAHFQGVKGLFFLLGRTVGEVVDIISFAAFSMFDHLLTTLREEMRRGNSRVEAMLAQLLGM